ncbi:MAG: PaaI family thioesterase [Haliangiales bacterium]
MPTMRMTRDELARFAAQSFPVIEPLAQNIYELAEGRISLRMKADQIWIRPGGTVSGPSLMTLADTAMYLLVLATLGPVELAVTTNLNIDFLRRPAPGDVLATGELLKLGSRLAVGRVTMYSDGDPAPVAHATVTYSLPPPHRR